MKRILVSTVFALLAVISGRSDVIWNESFSYPDGNITNVSGGLWINASGGSGDLLVANNKLQIAATGGNPVGRADDDYRWFSLTNGSVYTNSSQLVYASFTVNCTNLPNAAGTYFASFYNPVSGGNGGYWGRVYAGTSGTALPNTWRLGVAARQTGVSQIAPVDLALNTDYQVVVEWDPISLFAVSIWINPVDSNDPKTISSDALTPPTVAVNAYAIRQAGSFGNFFATLSNLVVATTFEEAATNVWTTNAVAPVIVRHPVGGTNFVGNPVLLSGLAAGQGQRNLTYTWLKNGGLFSNPDGNTNALAFFSAAAADSGAYQLVATTPFGLSVTSSVANLWVTNPPVAPTITVQPTNTSVYFGQTASISVGATGPGTITYTWSYNGGPLGPNVSGDGTPTLTITDVQSNNSTTGTYRCGVSNEFGGVLSDNAVLTATEVPAVSIAFLRTLVDPTTYNATNTTQLWKAVGTVSTFTNLTSGNTSSYYFQDSTAGINIFATFGSTFRPQQGDVVAFVGVLSSFNSTLELVADTVNNSLTSYTVLSNDTGSLPLPIAIPFGITNDLARSEALEGSIVMLTNVYFGTNAGKVVSTTANSTFIVTNAAGEAFNVFFSFQDLDTAGQTLPESAVSIIGPFTQNLGNAVTPRNQGYSVTVTRFSDIVTNALNLSIAHAANSSSLAWQAAPVTYPYTIWSANNVTGPYVALTNKLRFTDQNGVFTDSNAGGNQKYYRLSTP